MSSKVFIWNANSPEFFEKLHHCFHTKMFFEPLSEYLDELNLSGIKLSKDRNPMIILEDTGKYMGIVKQISKKDKVIFQEKGNCIYLAEVLLDLYLTKSSPVFTSIEGRSKLLVLENVTQIKGISDKINRILGYSTKNGIQKVSKKKSQEILTLIMGEKYE